MKTTYMTGICVEHDFKAVSDRVDQISENCGLSRSVIMRTALFDYFGVTPANEIKHKKILAEINEALGRK